MVPEGETLWLGIELSAEPPGTIELAVTSESDALCPLSNKRAVLIADKDVPVKVCVELFAARGPGKVRVEIEARSGRLLQRASVLVRVVPND